MTRPDDDTLRALAAGVYPPTYTEARAIAAEVLWMRQAVGDLLAIIHRDGGQHTASVGWAQSARDAERVVCDERKALRSVLGGGL